MANPSKQKGTAEETAIVGTWLLKHPGVAVYRTSPGMPYDVVVSGDDPIWQIDVLSTRPDRGTRLYTLRESDFMDLWALSQPEVHIESKRYARFALHTIFEGKFGR